VTLFQMLSETSPSSEQKDGCATGRVEGDKSAMLNGNCVSWQNSKLSQMKHTDSPGRCACSFQTTAKLMSYQFYQDATAFP
jgi:hypothetical protein